MTTGQLVAGLADRYRIERELGAGGMAIVHLAHDLRHDRRVALKVLRPELAAVIGAERFLAEIRTTANLQHPHILPLFDSGQIDGTVFYVMPFVEGESLRERLAREKQLPVDEAIRIAKEVADALQHAHERGVIHRDIKPENILLQGSHALVADFGIALAASRSDGGSRLTETGMSLGTPHYMSPEQATGQRELDGRTDIYALGCVLYELLAGEPPFTGPTPQAIIAKVMTTEAVPVTALRPRVPAGVAEALRAALQKIPADRPSSAARFATMLDGTGAGPTIEAPFAAAGSRSHRLARVVPWALLVGVAGVAGWRELGSRPAADSVVTRFVLEMPPGQGIRSPILVPLTISPDGRTIAYVTEDRNDGQLAVRRLDRVQTTLIPGTAKASLPRFASDGRTLFVNVPSGLLQIALDGSPPRTVAPAGVLTVGVSSPAGVLVSHLNGFTGFSVVGNGGRARVVSAPDEAAGELEHRHPVVLEDGRTILYSSWRGGALLSQLAIASIDSGPTTIFKVRSSLPLGYVDGHVLFVRPDGTLMAAPLDLGSRRITGDPIEILGEIAVTPAGGAAAAFSPAGTLTYVTGATETVPILVDEQGRVEVVDSTPRAYDMPRFSPDGRRLAYALRGSDAVDIWIYEFTSGTSTRLTNGGTNDRPEWSPDGRRIVFRSDRGARLTLWSQPADGSRPAEQLVDLPSNVNEGVFTPDGQSLVIRISTTNNRNDLYLLPLTGDRTPRPLAVARGLFNLAPRISPDGEWFAYSSDESGRAEIYIQRLDGTGGPARISIDGGTEPVWSRDGRRLFYRPGGSRRLTAASLRVLPAGRGDAATIEVVQRDVIHDGSLPVAVQASRSMYDVSPDGKRFLMLRTKNDAGQVVVVLNWVSELRARIAAARRQ